MANMTKNSNGKYELELTPTTSAQTKTIKVGSKYCDCDIDVKVNAIEDWQPTYTSSAPWNTDSGNGGYTSFDGKLVKGLLYTSKTSASDYAKYPIMPSIDVGTVSRYFILLGYPDMYFSLYDGSSIGSWWNCMSGVTYVKVTVTPSRVYVSGSYQNRYSATIESKAVGATSWTTRVSSSNKSYMYFALRKYSSGSSVGGAGLLLEIYPPE